MDRVIRIATRSGLLALLLGASACEVEKTSNPLSPTLAGPLPGVNITAPKPLEPLNGTAVPNAQQPIVLLIENPTSNSPRPFWLVIEVATDSGFAAIAYRADQVDPGPDGRTAHRLPGSLEPGRTYFWRIHAEDGANVGANSATFSFLVRPTTVIDPPVPLKPAGGETTASDAPDFVVRNGAVANPEGEVIYRFELSLDQSFDQLAAVLSVPRSSAETTTVTTGSLGGSRTIYWRVYGTDNKTTSARSSTAWFKTPAFVAPPSPGPSPGPTPVNCPPAPAGGYRTPDPPPGQQLPLPNMFCVVSSIAAQYPAALRNTCGSWEFLDRVIDTLRRYDTRWGYNWKRAVVGVASTDVINYHWGRGPDEGSRDVYSLDIVSQSCTAAAGPAWNNITNPNGAGAMWTGRGRF